MAPKPKYQEMLERATAELDNLEGRTIDVFTLRKPHDVEEAFYVAKIISKLSPIIGNLIEYELTRHLNSKGGWPEGTEWKRQDPRLPRYYPGRYAGSGPWN